VIGEHTSENVRVVSALMVPFVLVFGVYVIAHGHYGPGGGFAGGVVLAVAVVLARLTLDVEMVRRAFPVWLPIFTMAVGMALFFAAALVPALVGAEVLDYGAVGPEAMEPARRRYLGIMVVEVGVGAVVFGGIVMIFEALVASARQR
jgi:multicomponent Na+:H+ antiporter subunit B